MENSLTGRIQFENWRRMGSPKGFPFYARTKNKALHKFMLFINLVVMLFLMKWVSEDHPVFGFAVENLSLNESPDLVVCPASVVQVWVKEAKEKFPSLKVRILNQKINFPHSEDPCVWVASYTQLKT